MPKSCVQKMNKKKASKENIINTLYLKVISIFPIFIINVPNSLVLNER